MRDVMYEVVGIYSCGDEYITDVRIETITGVRPSTPGWVQFEDCEGYTCAGRLEDYFTTKEDARREAIQMMQESAAELIEEIARLSGALETAKINLSRIQNAKLD